MDRVKRLMIVLAAGCAVAAIFFFWPGALEKWQGKCGTGLRQKTAAPVPYARPPWMYAGVTNVVCKPLSKRAFEIQPDIDKSKVRLPEVCRVTVQPGVAANPFLKEVFRTISNAIETANQILKEKEYTVRYFSLSTTLYAKDKERNGIWYILPSSNSISTIRFEKYEDAGFTMFNIAEGYELTFKKDGSLHTFGSLDLLHFLRCDHATWDEYPFDIFWMAPISPTCAKELRFDAEGKVVGERMLDSKMFPSPF
ncbi:MAG: hypothetical protein PHX41_02380 [Kiritimatiellae bacterium]|nr:hypothetical protein [Kiritimatiellia bacterium]